MTTDRKISPLWQQILTANKNFVANHEVLNSEPVSKYPQRNLAVLACMDTRLLDFLEPAMGIVRGEAKIIKVAGNTFVGTFDAVIGSLMVAVYELHVEEIIVIGHDECGMMGTSAASLSAKMAERGINATDIKALQPKLDNWADGFKDVKASVLETVNRLRKNPYLPKDIRISGAIIHPHTGVIDLLDAGLEENK